jgi:hypothetical protein
MNTTVYHKESVFLPQGYSRDTKRNNELSQGTQWPITLIKEGILGVLYHVCTTYYMESLEYFEMSI